MANTARGAALIRDAVEVVVRRLSALPSSPEVSELRARASQCRTEAEAWIRVRPPPHEREALMKRALKLHLEVAALERGKPAV